MSEGRADFHATFEDVDTADEVQSSTEDQRVAANVQAWKTKLLDISKRNRALNFRPTKVTTILIKDEHPAEVFRRLAMDRGSMYFAPSASVSPPPNGRTSAQSSLSNDVIDDAEVWSDLEADSEGVSPVEAETLFSRHKDNLLQTKLTAENLDKSLRRIDDQARSSLEEQGVNTLFLGLGMMEYTEAEHSEEKFRAPLVLLPVSLSRTNARTGFKIQATDDDAIVNPALTEYLVRSFGLTLPALSDGVALPDDFDLRTFFREVSDLIANRPGWSLSGDSALGFFSFQKFVMYKDLEQNAAAFAGHRQVRQLVLRQGTSTRSLPDEVREAELDTSFPPEATAQVVNADASQLRAILAVHKGHDLVLEGPPGTGKSQTITNLIAQALEDGKSVLFVAEKMAALDVVHRRLSATGLAPFCLEMHSTKANRRAVMQEIATALDASLEGSPTRNSSASRIGGLRNHLTTYTRAVHEPWGALQMSPFDGYGELEAVREAPKVKFSQPAQPVLPDELHQAGRDLRDVGVAVVALGDPVTHPWRYSQRTFYSEVELDTVGASLDTCLKLARLLSSRGVQLETETGISAPVSLRDVDGVVALVKLLAKSPSVTEAVLRSDAWNAPPSEAVALLRRGKALSALKSVLLEQFHESVLVGDHGPDIDFIEAKESGSLRFLNSLNSRYRQIRSRWSAMRRPSYAGSLLDQAKELRRTGLYHTECRHLTDSEPRALDLFGSLWSGEATDWGALERYVEWVVAFRKAFCAKALQDAAVATVLQATANTSRAEALAAVAGQLTAAIAELTAFIQWPTDYLFLATVQETIDRLDTMRKELGSAPRWATFELARQRAHCGIGKDALAASLAGELAFANMPHAFRRAFFMQWISEAVQERPPLQEFHSLTHEERVKEFATLDEQVLQDNRARLIGQMRARVQARLKEKDAAEQLPFLRGQLSRQRGLSPLRETMKRSPAAIRAIKPVFMMSPSTVSQFLDNATEQFDLVVFDEASQLPTEEAVGAIARGKQLVVVGDPKQLPPTNFFAVMNGTIEAPKGEDGLPLFEDSQSILEDFMASGAPMSRLKWHYRSLHEALIHFSNVSFYGDLYTFPSVHCGTQNVGLSFEWVHDGVYEGHGLNMAEARRVCEEVVRFAKAHPQASLGVGTFNLRQQLAVQDELERLRRLDPSLEPFFSRDKREPFFVKNLENIQGDERDVIFLSVTYGKDEQGTLRYNFGPLNGENGWRRMNVLTTRARKAMRVFSSLRGSDINPARVTSQGPQLLRDFLNYAEHGRLESSVVAVAGQTESPFEREVCVELQRRGLRLQPQVGVGRYRIDVGVLDDEADGRYVCGIECDGVAYHQSETARDRDRLRQQVLEDRGWTIFRVWSTDWFKDRAGQIDRLLRLIDQARSEARVQQETEAEDLERSRSQDDRVPSFSEGEQDAAEGEATEAVIASTILTAQPYSFAPMPLRFRDWDFVSSPSSYVTEAIMEVLTIEAPLHITDLATRVTKRWGYSKVSSRMLQFLKQVLCSLEQSKAICSDGDFVALPETNVTVRNRVGTGIPGDRVSPDEYRLATMSILRETPGLDRQALIGAVRSMLGYNRTGSLIDRAVSQVIDGLIAADVVGQGSTGLRLLESQ